MINSQQKESLPLPGLKTYPIGSNETLEMARVSLVNKKQIAKKKHALETLAIPH